YLSVENLCKDLYLRTHMDANGGWLDIDFIANFNRVRALTDSVDLLRDAMNGSDLIEVQDGKKLRRKDDWARWVM
ncbi:hypothetical protein BC828DRAFT_339842, partial [Blastocladiella britannica]